MKYILAVILAILSVLLCLYYLYIAQDVILTNDLNNARGYNITGSWHVRFSGDYVNYEQNQAPDYYVSVEDKRGKLVGHYVAYVPGSRYFLYKKKKDFIGDFYNDRVTATFNVDGEGLIYVDLEKTDDPDILKGRYKYNSDGRGFHGDFLGDVIFEKKSSELIYDSAYEKKLYAEDDNTSQ